MRKLGLYLAEMRAPFLTASILPIILGTAVAWFHSGEILWEYFALTLVGGILLHAGANVANDYFDHLSGCDENNTEFIRPFTGGSRMIQKGLLSPKEVYIEALVLIITGSLIGIFLAITRGYYVLVFGVAGVFCGYFYTAPPVRLAARGIGEIIVGLNFGILMMLGAFYVQVQYLSLDVFIASIPLAALITAVLLINEFQDAEADGSAGKKHLVVRLGKKRSARLFALIMFLPYIVVVIASFLGIMPLHALPTLCVLPVSLFAIRTALNKHNDSKALAPANALTVITHLAVGIFLISGYFLSGGQA